jgi:multiple sugar transport system permease protein
MHLCFHRQLRELFRPLLQSLEKFPAAVTIYQLFGQYGYVAYGRLAAYSILYMMPTFILYYLAQNYMSEGFTMSGATKG